MSFSEEEYNKLKKDYLELEDKFRELKEHANNCLMEASDCRQAYDTAVEERNKIIEDRYELRKKYEQLEKRNACLENGQLPLAHLQRALQDAGQPGNVAGIERLCKRIKDLEEALMDNMTEDYLRVRVGVEEEVMRLKQELEDQKELYKKDMILLRENRNALEEGEKAPGCSENLVADKTKDE